MNNCNIESKKTETNPIQRKIKQRTEFKKVIYLNNVYFFYFFPLQTGKRYCGAAFRGDSILRPQNRPQTVRPVQRTVFYTRHLHSSDSGGE